MFNFNHLHYFFVTARLGGISKAAQFLSTSQPSLSAQIKVLEGVMGKKLFEKQGRNIRLTKDGERVYQYCQRMFSVSEELERFLKDSNPSELTHFRIGVTEQIDRPFIADLISKLAHSNRKRQRLHVRSGKKDELLADLRNQQIDLVLTNSPASGTEFQQVAQVDMRVGLFMAKELHQNFFRRAGRATKLRTWLQEDISGLVLPSEKLKLRHETDHFLEKHSLKPESVLESDILSIVVRSVVDGVGIGFLPVPYLSGELSAGSVVQIFPETNLWNHKLYMITRVSEILHPVTKEMIAAMGKIEENVKLPKKR